MRRLKPLTIFVGGSLLLAIAVAICAAVAQPGIRDPRGIAVVLVLGLVLGMFMFGPIAAADAFRAGFVRRHFERLERWSSLLLAMGLGHWIGSGMGDTGIVIAAAAMCLAACFRVYLSELGKRPAA